MEELSEYIPDFKFNLYDLTRFSDDEIKGTVMARVMLLLFKHVFEPDLPDKLPGILSLMRELMDRTPDCSIWRPFCAIFSAHLTVSQRKK